VDFSPHENGDEDFLPVGNITLVCFFFDISIVPGTKKVGRFYRLALLLHRQVNIKNVMPDPIRHPAKVIMNPVFRRNDRNEAIKLPK